MDLILSKNLLTRNIPTIHSNIWYSPRPGHSPRFDPKKLRESMKLNLSTEVFFTLTSSLKEKRNRKPPDLVTVPSSTVATVLRQGRRQSDTVSPANKSSVLNTTSIPFTASFNFIFCFVLKVFLKTFLYVGNENLLTVLLDYFDTIETLFLFC